MAPSYPENNSVDPEYVDIWPCLRCPGGKQPHLDPSSSHSHPIEEDPPGFTEDTTINTMRFIQIDNNRTLEEKKPKVPFTHLLVFQIYSLRKKTQTRQI